MSPIMFLGHKIFLRVGFTLLFLWFYPIAVTLSVYKPNAYDKFNMTRPAD